MAKEYIERNYLLIGGIHYKNAHVSEEGLVMIPLRDIRKSIKEAPAADVVEVVRCKDCRYLQHSFATDTVYCDWHRDVFETCPDNYCSYGERRDA